MTERCQTLAVFGLSPAPIGAFTPGIASTVVALSFSLAGDGLRDALNPKEVGTR